METANCNTVITLFDKKEILPSKILLPPFKKIALPIAVKNSTGSNQEEVVNNKIKKIKIKAITKIIFICVLTLSSVAKLCGASPTKYPLSPVIFCNSRIAFCVVLLVSPCLKVISIMALLSL